MGTVHTLQPRPRGIDPAYIRPVIEEAVQGALDAADKLIALLDTFDGDPEAEDAGDAEPSLGAPEGHESQIAWLRGTTRDLEQDGQPVDLDARRGRDTPFSLRRPFRLT